MFFKFLLSKKTTDQSLQHPHWPSYLHNKCGNPFCRFPNPPQAAKGKYVCCGTVRGRPCQGTYYVTGDAVALVMKQHKMTVRKEDKERRKAEEKPKTYRALDTPFPEPSALASRSSLPRNRDNGEDRRVSDRRANKRDPLPPIPPAKYTTSVKHAEGALEPERQARLPKEVGTRQKYQTPSRSTPHLPSSKASTTRGQVRTAAVAQAQPSPVRKVLKTTHDHGDPRGFQIHTPYLVKEKLYYQSQRPY